MLFEKIKKGLRISHSALDDEISLNIDTAKLDLQLAGVEKLDDNDALIIKAMTLYCRWQFDYDNQADRYELAYTALKIALSLSGDYNAK